MSSTLSTSASQASSSKGKGKAPANTTSSVPAGDNAEDSDDEMPQSSDDDADEDESTTEAVYIVGPWTVAGSYLLSDGTKRNFNSRKAYNQFRRRAGGALLRDPPRGYIEAEKMFLVDRMVKHPNTTMGELTTMLNAKFSPPQGGNPRSKTSVSSLVSQQGLKRMAKAINDKVDILIKAAESDSEDDPQSDE